MLAESEDPISRNRPLAAAVEIALAAGELDTAAKAADELRATAGELGTALLRARAAYAEGAVLLARGDVKRAIAELRRCLDGFNALEVRADAARARLLIAECCDALDDTDGAETERRTAQATLTACAAPGDKSTLGGLSSREIEVLRLVAQGKTNPEIAKSLNLSPKSLLRRKARGEIRPAVQRGKLIRWRGDEVLR